MKLAPAIVAALTASGAFGPTSAHADEQLDKARLVAARGRAFFDGGDYAAAIDAYHQAYALAPRPGLLFNLGQAYRLAGNCAEAATMYRQYLGSEPNDEHRELAKDQLAHLDERCGPRETATPITDASPRGPDATAQRREQIGIWLALGGGGALALAAVFALDAHDASDTVNNAYTTGTRTTDLAATADRGQHNADLATAFGIAGGLAVVSGTVLYALGVHAERAQHAAIVPTLHGAEVHLTWQF